MSLRFLAFKHRRLQWYRDKERKFRFVKSLSNLENIMGKISLYISIGCVFGNIWFAFLFKIEWFHIARWQRILIYLCIHILAGTVDATESLLFRGNRGKAMQTQLLANEPIVKTFPIGSFKQSTRRVWLEDVQNRGDAGRRIFYELCQYNS